MPHGTHEQLCSITSERILRPILRIPMTDFMDFVWGVFFSWKSRPHSMRSVINSSTLGVLCELLWPQYETVRNCTIGFFHGEWPRSPHLAPQPAQSARVWWCLREPKAILPSNWVCKNAGVEEAMPLYLFSLDPQLTFRPCPIIPKTGLPVCLSQTVLPCRVRRAHGLPLGHQQLHTRPKFFRRKTEAFFLKYFFILHCKSSYMLTMENL